MRNGDWLVGFGCATALYPTHTGVATARVQITANGDALVQSATGIRVPKLPIRIEKLLVT
jgi:hypothetical protein